MKLLSELLTSIDILKASGDLSIPVRSIQCDSRKVKQGSVFIAYKGVAVDGHDFIQEALDHDAVAIVAEQDAPDYLSTVAWIQVADSRTVVGELASAFYDFPSREMRIAAVTGTNGKTTISTLGFEVLSQLGIKVGLISTAGIRIGEATFEATQTTPDPIQLHDWLAQMRDEGCEWVWMEVSSHALDQDRVAGINFDLGIFSNLSHDHLDYHGSFANYRDAKKKLFDHLSDEAIAVVNLDDKNGRYMLQNTKATPITYGTYALADVRLKILEMTFEGTLIRINGQELLTMLLGEYNIYNLSSVLAGLMHMGYEKEALYKAASMVKGAEGRFDRVLDQKQNRLGIVDYAHSPDALENILLAIQRMNVARGRIITVVGCGGDRDATKRPIMGRIAARLSDKAIFTSDNPRSEDPDQIIKDMIQGMDVDLRSKVMEVTDRRQAIQVACRIAEAGDIVLVAGKGHEKVQVIKNKKIVFDDKQELNEALQ